MNKNKLLEFDIRKLKHKDNFDLGGKSKKTWTNHIIQTIELLENKTPKSYSKIRNHIKHIIPYGYIKGIQKSLSYVDSPGIIYLSYQDDLIIQAEAIIHEVNHTILFEFSKNDPGILNPYEAKYYSAVQNRPRELHNCFLALHAFVHVLEFYIELIENIIINKELAQTIFSAYLKSESLLNVIQKHSSFTKKGKRLFGELNKSLENSESKIKKLEKKYPKEFKTAQEEQFKHFEDISNKFDDILF